MIQEVYRQQLQMWSEKKRSIEHRIVSLSQHHVRPLVRGKASSPTEFGANLSVAGVVKFISMNLKI